MMMVMVRRIRRATMMNMNEEAFIATIVTAVMRLVMNHEKC